MDLHLYLYDGGIGLMNRDWLPVIAALESQATGKDAAARIRDLVSDDPAKADAYIEVAMDRDQIGQLLGVVLDACDRKVAAAREQTAALERLAAAEVAREETTN